MAAAGVLEFPEDLWFDVLFKVPAGDVARFRRLSKFHRKLIDGPEFRQKHSNNRSIKTTTPYVIVTGSESSSCEGADYHVDLRNSNTFLKLNPPIKKEKLRSDNDRLLVACSMGILCYNLPHQECLLLWNPLTGCSRRIPYQLQNLRCTSFCCFLGYDDETNDLKVLRMAQYHVRKKQFCSDSAIYSSNTNSWTDVDQVSMTGVFLEANNSVNWKEGNCRIEAFNISTQEFSTFGRPRFSDDRYEDWTFSSFDGCLCLYMNPRRKYCLKVWTMKEYGDEKSWTQVFSIRHCINNAVSLQPLVLVNNGSQLVISCPRDGLYLYDVQTSEMHTAELKKHLDFKLLELEKISRTFVYTPTFRKP